jgi:hypothetical protein
MLNTVIFIFYMLYIVSIILFINSQILIETIWDINLGLKKKKALAGPYEILSQKSLFETIS